jgi:hypothetical protein
MLGSGSGEIGEAEECPVCTRVISAASSTEDTLPSRVGVRLASAAYRSAAGRAGPWPVVAAVLGCVSTVEEGALSPVAMYPLSTLNAEVGRGGESMDAEWPVCTRVLS